jgi:hypothetical protein
VARAADSIPASTNRNHTGMIDPLKLTIEDKGKLVEYRPLNPAEPREQGRIVGWTDKLIYVDYGKQPRGLATSPNTLHFV